MHLPEPNDMTEITTCFWYHSGSSSRTWYHGLYSFHDDGADYSGMKVIDGGKLYFSAAVSGTLWGRFWTNQIIQPNFWHYITLIHNIPTG